MKLIVFFLIIVFISILFVVIESIIECKKIKITKYLFKSKKINKNGERIVMISDFHNALHFLVNDFLLKKIVDMRPDVIVLAGDMLVCHSDELDACRESLSFINRLSEIAPVYYCMGNHEMGFERPRNKYSENEKNIMRAFWKEFKDGLNDNIYLLKNEEAVFEDSKKGNIISFFGIDLKGDYYKRIKHKKIDDDLLESFKNNDKSLYSVLLAHNPDYFEDYCRLNYDLIFSGHNHGGLVNIPILGGVISPRLNIFPKYDYGLYSNNDTNMILSNGLGAHTLKIRVNNIPEIVVVDIVNE